MTQQTNDQPISTYLTHLSHEMRTPLNSILGFTHLLSEANSDATQLEWLNHIQENGQHLLQLINDIIDNELLNQQQVSLNNEPIDIYELVKLVQQGLQPQAIIGQLSLTCHIAPDCPHFWRGDKRKIKQILINLMGNAIKFTPPQGEVHVSISQVLNGLRISVSDTGSGINTDALSQLFTPYYHNMSSVNQQGIGIGLDITRRLIELMKGEILVNSQPDEGAEFIIILPLAICDFATQQAAQDGKTELIAPTSLLLVDDDRLHHDVLHHMLKHLPIVIYHAYSAKEAIQRYQEQPTQLVIIDYQLPDSNGITLAKKLQQIQHHQQATLDSRLFILSAQSQQSAEKSLLDGTLDGWITKPIQFEQLIHLANNYHRYKAEQPKQQQQAQVATTAESTLISTALTTENTQLHLHQLPAYLQSLWPEFEAELQQGLQQAETWLTQKNFTKLMTKAHQLKGQAMVFQQKQLIYLLEQLEQSAQNKDDATCQALLNQAQQFHSTDCTKE